jgi:flagellar motor switch protein FliG
MMYTRLAVGTTVAAILLASIGCGHAVTEVHANTMTPAEYQQNIDKINNDPSMSPNEKQTMIDEFKAHVKVGSTVSAK